MIISAQVFALAAVLQSDFLFLYKKKSNLEAEYFATSFYILVLKQLYVISISNGVISATEGQFWCMIFAQLSFYCSAGLIFEVTAVE